MGWRFADFELDPARFELRRDGERVHAEPQVLQLLQLLVDQRHRMLTKDEIVDTIWDGRAISDSALSSRIKTARQLIGDDGKAQRLIKTIHGKGFRFVGEVVDSRPAVVANEAAELAVQPELGPKPSIAVLPFRLIGAAGPYGSLAEALPTDLIADLSRLRWLFVISRASSFRLRGQGEDLGTVGKALGARYALSGVVEVVGTHLKITVELGDTRDGGVVWTERFEAEVEAVHEVRRDIASAVIGAIELEIPLHEARKARLSAPDSLDAWSAYHLGLSHLFKGLPSEMAQARAMFERAIELDPGFARAKAGLSSAHFMPAFVHRDRDARGAARRFAEEAMALEPNDPFVNMALGRSLWLEDDLEGSLPWLERANSLNPNYAQAIYSRGWTEALLGDHEKCDERALLSLKLSPLDPLGYAMVGIRSFAAMGRGDAEAAAAYAVQAARMPGAHALIHMLATVGSAMVGNEADAERFAASARQLAPEATSRTYLRAFPFRDDQVRDENEKLLAKFGF